MAGTDGRQMRASEVQGDMHWLREIQRVGSGKNGEVVAEDRGKSGYAKGAALRVAWCGTQGEAGAKFGGGGGGGGKMTYNRALVTCDDCVEAEGLYRAAEQGARTPVEEFTDDEWIKTLNKFGPKVHIWTAQRWVWEQRMAAME